MATAIHLSHGNSGSGMEPNWDLAGDIVTKGGRRTEGRAEVLRNTMSTSFILRRYRSGAKSAAVVGFGLVVDINTRAAVR